MASLRQAVRAVARHRRVALATAAAVALACALIVGLGREDRYEATARIHVNTEKALKPLMAGLTYQPDIDQQMTMLARTLLSHDNVAQLATIPALSAETGDPSRREAVIQTLMDRIRVTPSVSSPNLFQISYRGRSPESARELVARTLDLFVRSGTDDKRRDSREAGAFIDAQIHDYETKLAQAETRLKEFKIRNLGVIGVAAQDYFSRTASLRDEVDKLRMELAAAERARQALRSELAAEQARMAARPTLRTAEGAPSDAEQRLGAFRRQLDEMRRRFTESHPDVIAVRRSIQALERDVAAERREQAERDAVAGRVAGESAPVYQHLRVSIADAEARVAGLRAQLSSKQAQLDRTQGDANRTPQVEAELSQLNRDYDVMRKNYEQLVARRESAALAVKLDESSQLADFRVIEPPTVEARPVFPSRLHLAIGSLALAALAGAGAALLVERLRPSIDNLTALREFSGRPVVGTVSTLISPAGVAAQRTAKLRAGAVAALVVLAQLAWIAWLARRLS